MVEGSWAGLILRLYAYFQAQAPKKETMRLWYEDVKFIPEEALPWIENQLRSLERIPHNLAGKVKNLWIEWRQAHHQKTERGHGCHRGHWEVARYRKELDEWAIYRFPCAVCHELDRGIRTFDQLLWEGHYDKEPNRFMTHPPEWAFIYPDKDNLGVKIGELRAYLANRKVQEGNITVEDLPF